MAGGYGSNSNKGVNLDGFHYGDSNIYIEDLIKKPTETEPIILDSEKTQYIATTNCAEET